MFTSNLIELLNNDLKNEYKHMNFYLYYASLFTGPHHDSMRDLFLKQASSEMNHIHQFSKLIVGLDGKPTSESNLFDVKLKNTKEIVFAAIEMEEEVVKNYVQRCRDAETLNTNLNTLSVTAKYVQIFLEEQIQDSQSDIDHMKQIFKGL
jgi:bacterioferritin (cytochrome b1)